VTDLGNDAMETAALVAESWFSSSKFAEVTRGHWAYIVVELEDDSPDGLGVDCDVKLRAKWSQLRNYDVDVE
jgi:hypothetical protein